ncbi:hypothetical protein F5884DRAFT_861975 [Xylogone sp. PMI_703]|nr:hypothetical protein F5884DRAFT_861975 [Xylogone sp. PMI_703]
MEQQPTPPMKIRIILPEDIDPAKSNLDPPVRHCGDKIEGYLEVTTCRDLEFDIDLGVARTWISASDNLQDASFLPSTAEILFLDENQKLSPNGSRKTYDGDLCIHHIPFLFIIPHELISGQSDLHPSFLKLCPTTKEGLELWWPLTRKRYRQPMIVYMIRVKSIRSDKPIGNVVNVTEKREITVMPFTATSPPVVMDSFPGEYISSATTTLKRYRWRQSLGTLKVSAAEPPPLNILSHSPKQSTTLVLSIIFEPNGVRGYERPDSRWIFIVTQQLRIRTFYSTRKLERVPTASTSKRDPFLRFVERKRPSETREYDKIVWRKEYDSPWLGRSYMNSTWFSTNITVPIVASKSLLPTFLNPLASRRYAVVIQLSIKGLSNKTMDLVLPIQVIYWPLQAIDRGADEYGATELPADASMSFEPISGLPPAYE